MASDNLTLPFVMFLIMCSGALGNKLLSLECQPAVGVVGQTITIHCSFKTSFGEENISIEKLFVNKVDQDDPLFSFPIKTGTEDPRFSLQSENSPSLELTNSAVSDEGKYTYTILTDRGVDEGIFWISVTAKYSQPIASSWPNVIEDGGSADLYCNSSGGYPAGAIHWFDKSNTNWTKSATLRITEGEDKLKHMSSKLPFGKIDSSWAPFRCVVLNNKFVMEGERSFQPSIKEGSKQASKTDINKLPTTSIIAPIVVIGSLLVGLLLLILLRGRCSHQTRRLSTVPFLSHHSVRTYVSGDDSDVEKAMNSGELKGEDADLKIQRPED